MKQPVERPHILVPIARNTPPGKIPVASIGRRDPSSHQPAAIVEDIASLIYGDATTQSLLDTDTLKSMPQWALALMNQNRLMSIELAAFYSIMVNRGLLTPAEVKQMRRSIQQQHDETFQRMVNQLGRQMQQKPNAIPLQDPSNPRRNPA